MDGLGLPHQERVCERARERVGVEGSLVCVCADMCGVCARVCMCVHMFVCACMCGACACISECVCVECVCACRCDRMSVCVFDGCCLKGLILIADSWGSFFLVNTYNTHTHILKT